MSPKSVRRLHLVFLVFFTILSTTGCSQPKSYGGPASGEFVFKQDQTEVTMSAGLASLRQRSDSEYVLVFRSHERTEVGNEREYRFQLGCHINKSLPSAAGVPELNSLVGEELELDSVGEFSRIALKQEQADFEHIRSGHLKLNSVSPPKPVKDEAGYPCVRWSVSGQFTADTEAQEPITGGFHSDVVLVLR